MKKQVVGSSGLNLTFFILFSLSTTLSTYGQVATESGQLATTIDAGNGCSRIVDVRYWINPSCQTKEVTLCAKATKSDDKPQLDLALSKNGRSEEMPVTFLQATGRSPANDPIESYRRRVERITFGQQDRQLLTQCWRFEGVSYGEDLEATISTLDLIPECTAEDSSLTVAIVPTVENTVSTSCSFPDSDGDGVGDDLDPAVYDAARCGDADADQCDDCSFGNGPNTFADGPDKDADGECDYTDVDDDNDGILDGQDPSPFDPLECGDNDNNGFDDCSTFDAVDEEKTTPAGLFDVGVIPNTPNTCPAGSSLVWIYMDDEDTRNNSWQSGQVGATVTNQGNTGTRFYFCRVDGLRFNPHPVLAYAVLQLGSYCPPGTKRVLRQWDNETNNNQNGSGGDLGPNIDARYGWLLSFCFFEPEGQILIGSSPRDYFPDLGVPYNIFSEPHHYWLDATGTVHTDDQDGSWLRSNWNSWTSDFVRQRKNIEDLNIDGASRVMFGEVNTTLNLGLVGKSCHGQDPCPEGGVFDGHNCYMYSVPGRPPFIWQDGLYYEGPVWHPDGPCPHPAIDNFNHVSYPASFDSANCYLGHFGPNPFIWNDNYYLQANCSGCNDPCPYAGTFDGANCYLFTWPGVDPFIWSNNWYYEPVWHPRGPCPHKVFNNWTGQWVQPTFDGANCYIGSAGPGRQAFLWDNNYYQTPACIP